MVIHLRFFAISLEICLHDEMQFEIDKIMQHTFCIHLNVWMNSEVIGILIRKRRKEQISCEKVISCTHIFKSLVAFRLGLRNFTFSLIPIILNALTSFVLQRPK